MNSLKTIDDGESASSSADSSAGISESEVSPNACSAGMYSMMGDGGVNSSLASASLFVWASSGIGSEPWRSRTSFRSENCVIAALRRAPMFCERRCMLSTNSISDLCCFSVPRTKCSYFASLRCLSKELNTVRWLASIDANLKLSISSFEPRRKLWVIPPSDPENASIESIMSWRSSLTAEVGHRAKDTKYDTPIAISRIIDTCAIFPALKWPSCTEP